MNLIELAFDGKQAPWQLKWRLVKWMWKDRKWEVDSRLEEDLVWFINHFEEELLEPFGIDIDFFSRCWERKEIIIIS